MGVVEVVAEIVGVVGVLVTLKHSMTLCSPLPTLPLFLNTLKHFYDSL